MDKDHYYRQLLKAELENQCRALQPQTDSKDVCLVHTMRVGVLLRFMPACLFFVIALGFLIRHLYCLQVGRHEEFSKKSEVLYIHRRDMPSYRGRIMDRNGNVLAVDQPAMDFYAEPGRFADRTDEVVTILKGRLGLDEPELRRRMKKGIDRELSFTVVSDLTPERARSLEGYCTRALVLKGEPEGMHWLQYYPGREDEKQRAETVARLSELLDIDQKSLENSVHKTLGRFAEVPLQWKVPLEESREVLSLL